MKKITVLLLALSLTLSLIGCDKEDNSDNNVLTPAVTNNQEAASDVTEAEDINIEESTSSVIFSKESEERIYVEGSAGDAIELYLVARMYLDKFLQYDIENGTPEEYEKLLNCTVGAFESVEVAADSLKEDAAALEELEADESYNSTDNTGTMGAVILPEINDNGFWNPFIVDVYAAEESEAIKWAKDITETFDKAPVGKGIRTLAEQMGTDAKHAYAQLTQAQEILKGASYEDFAQTADTCYKTAKVLKTAGTAAQLTLSIVTANPTTVVDAVITSGGILVNGMNTMLEVGQTGSVLIVGNDNKLSAKLENIEDAIAPIGSALGLYSLSTNILKGSELLNDVPAVADSMMYMGTSLNDYLTDGKILSGAFTQNEDGTISCTLKDTMTVKNQWAKTEEILKANGYSDEEIEEVKEVAENNVEVSNEDNCIPTELIDEHIDTMASYLPETVWESGEDGLVSPDDAEDTEDSEIIKEEEKLSEDTSEDSKAEETVAEENQESEIPSIDEVVGTYPFVLTIVFGDQSAEGEAPQVIAKSGSDALTMTDVDGETLSGKYDSSTGKAVFHDTDGTPVTVTFTRNSNGGIHAKLKMTADYGSMSGETNKK